MIRVFVVEDDGVTMMSVCFFLRQLGCYLVGTSVGDDDEGELVEEIVSSGVDLLMIDIGLMGKVDGDKIVDEVIARGFNGKVVFMTGSDASDRARISVKGKVLEKPFDYKEVRDILQEIK